MQTHSQSKPKGKNKKKGVTNKWTNERTNRSFTHSTPPFFSARLHFFSSLRVKCFVFQVFIVKSNTSSDRLLMQVFIPSFHITPRLNSLLAQYRARKRRGKAGREKKNRKTTKDLKQAEKETACPTLSPPISFVFLSLSLGLLRFDLQTKPYNCFPSPTPTYSLSPLLHVFPSFSCIVLEHPWEGATEGVRGADPNLPGREREEARETRREGGKNEFDRGSVAEDNTEFGFSARPPKSKERTDVISSP